MQNWEAFLIKALQSVSFNYLSYLLQYICQIKEEIKVKAFLRTTVRS